MNNRVAYNIPQMDSLAIREMRSMDTDCERKLWIAVIRQYFKDLRTTLSRSKKIKKESKNLNKKRNLRRHVSKIEKTVVDLYKLRKDAESAWFGYICLSVGLCHLRFIAKIREIIENEDSLNELERIITLIE